jgi:hypothetical protein
MGRKAATIEYLDRLVEWAGSRTAFCRLTGIKQPNLAGSVLSVTSCASCGQVEHAFRGRLQFLLGGPGA